MNESGSVWGGSATLVEEASIGVAEGADAYMFGEVGGVAVTEDRIFALDRSIPTVRVYDLEGDHLRDVGRGGQGPGEFTSPYLLAVSQDGRVFVRTFSGLVVFDRAGNHLMSVGERGGIVRPMVVREDGAVYIPISPPAPSTDAYLLVTPDGTRGEPVQEPSLVDWTAWQLQAGSSRGRHAYSMVPYAPSTVWTLAPSGAVIQAASSEYRIEVRHPDGKSLVIERRVATVPVPEEERAWNWTLQSLRMRRLEPGWEWNANRIPDRKPVFEEFHTDHRGTLWVRRIVDTDRVDDCDTDPAAAIAEQRRPRPCFRNVEVYDVFDTDGRYLGQVPIPPIARVGDPAIRGHTLVQAVEDEAGTIMVKRYRLVLPGSPGA